MKMAEAREFDTARSMSVWEQVEVEGVVDLRELELREKLRVRPPGVSPAGDVTVDPARRERVVTVTVVMQGQADLLEVVDALDPPGGLSGRLHGRQQQRDQHRDDGDDDQQLDQRESPSAHGPTRIDHPFSRHGQRLKSSSWDDRML